MLIAINRSHGILVLIILMVLNSVMNEETEKSMKSKEQRMQTKVRLEGLMKNIDLE